MEEKTKKSAEQMAQEGTANNLLNFIIAKTFSRHSKMSEEEFLKDIGFEGSGKSEEEAVRIAKFNVIVEIMKQLIQAKESVKFTKSLLKTCLVEEEIVEKKEDK